MTNEEIIYDIPLYFTCEMCKIEVSHMLACFTQLITELRPCDPSDYKLTCKNCWREHDKQFLAVQKRIATRVTHIALVQNPPGDPDIRILESKKEETK